MISIFFINSEAFVSKLIEKSWRNVSLLLTVDMLNYNKWLYRICHFKTVNSFPHVIPHFDSDLALLKLWNLDEIILSSGVTCLQDIHFIKYNEILRILYGYLFFKNFESVSSMSNVCSFSLCKGLCLLDRVETLCLD